MGSVTDLLRWRMGGWVALAAIMAKGVGWRGFLGFGKAEKAGRRDPRRFLLAVAGKG